MKKTKQSRIKFLILFICVALIGISSILTGFLLDKHGRDTFVPKKIGESYNLYAEDSGDFSALKSYYAKSDDSYNIANPTDYDLYIITDYGHADEPIYGKTTDTKFGTKSYFSYNEETTKYNKVSAYDLGLYKEKDIMSKYHPAFYIYLLEIIGAAIFLLSFGYLYAFLEAKFNLKKMTIKQMSVIAIFGALSVILYYFAKFNLPIFPSWLDIQFSDVPALFASFMYGPVSGVLVIVVRFFCKLPGTSTVGVGELADLLIGITLCIISGLIYKKHRSIKGALCAMAIGMASATVVAVISNWLILIPAYKEIAGFPQVALTSTMDKLLGGKGIVTDSNFMLYYLGVGVLPFNLFRYTLVFIITFILYKRLKKLICYFVGDFNKNENIIINDEEEVTTSEITE